LTSHVLALRGHVLVSPKKRSSVDIEAAEDLTRFGDIECSDDSSDEQHERRVSSRISSSSLNLTDKEIISSLSLYDKDNQSSGVFQ
jgi:hypothetical protein